MASKSSSSRQSEAVIGLRYKVTNRDEYKKFRQSILDLKKPVKEVSESLDRVADKRFTKLGASVRGTNASLSAMVTRIRSINDSLNKIKARSLTVKINTGTANNSIKRVTAAFSKMGVTARAVFRRINADITKLTARIKRLGGVIRIKGVAQLHTASFISRLNELVRSSEEAGRRIREALNISASGGGGGGPNPHPNNGNHGGGGNSGNTGSGGSSDAESQGVGFARRMMGGFAAFTAGKELVREAVSLRDEWVSSMNTLKFITGDIYKAKEAQTGLLEVSRETHSSYEATRDLFVSFQQIADKTKLSIQDNIGLTKTVQAAAKLGGGGPEQNKLAITQLEQAIKKGKMDQQDLHSIEMFSPGITSTMAKGLDISVAELRNRVHKGLKAEDIIKSFQKMGPEIAKLNAEADLTFGNIKEYAHSVFFEIVGDVVSAGDGLKTVYAVILKGLDAVRSGWKSFFGTLTEWLGSAQEAAEYVQMALASLGGGAVIAGLVALGSALAVAFWPVTLATAAVFGLLVAFKQVQKWMAGEGSLLDRFLGDYKGASVKIDAFMARIKAVMADTVAFLIRIWEPIKGIFFNLYEIFKVVILDVFHGVVGLMAAVGDLFGVGGSGTPLEKAFNTMLAIGAKMQKVFEDIINVVQTLTSFIANIFNGDSGELIRKLTRLGLTVEAIIRNWLEVAFLKIMAAITTDEDKRKAYNQRAEAVSSRDVNKQTIQMAKERGLGDIRSAKETATDNLNDPTIKREVIEVYREQKSIEDEQRKYNAAVDEASNNHGVSSKYSQEELDKWNERINTRLDSVQSKMDKMESIKDHASTYEMYSKDPSKFPEPKAAPLPSYLSMGRDRGDAKAAELGYVMGNLTKLGPGSPRQSAQTINSNNSVNNGQNTFTQNNSVVVNADINDLNDGLRNVIKDAAKDAVVSFGDTVESGVRSIGLGWTLPKEDKSGGNVARFDRSMGISPTEATGK